jgi:hypothetical protein
MSLVQQVTNESKAWGQRDMKALHVGSHGSESEIKVPVDGWAY